MTSSCYFSALVANPLLAYPNFATMQNTINTVQLVLPSKVLDRIIDFAIEGLDSASSVLAASTRNLILVAKYWRNRIGAVVWAKVKVDMYAERLGVRGFGVGFRDVGTMESIGKWATHVAFVVGRHKTLNTGAKSSYRKDYQRFMNLCSSFTNVRQVVIAFEDSSRATRHAICNIGNPATTYAQLLLESIILPFLKRKTLTSLAIHNSASFPFSILSQHPNLQSLEIYSDISSTHGSLYYEPAPCSAEGSEIAAGAGMTKNCGSVSTGIIKSLVLDGAVASSIHLFHILLHPNFYLRDLQCLEIVVQMEAKRPFQPLARIAEHRPPLTHLNIGFHLLTKSLWDCKDIYCRPSYS